MAKKTVKDLKLLDEEQLDTISTLGSVIISELRKALVGWKPWGTTVLDMYLNGQKKEVFKYLIQECGEPRSTAFRHKDDFEEFVKKFLLE